MLLAYLVLWLKKIAWEKSNNFVSNYNCKGRSIKPQVKSQRKEEILATGKKKKKSVMVSNGFLNFSYIF